MISASISRCGGPTAGTEPTRPRPLVGLPAAPRTRPTGRGCWAQLVGWPWPPPGASASPWRGDSRLPACGRGSPFSNSRAPRQPSVRRVAVRRLTSHHGVARCAPVNRGAGAGATPPDDRWFSHKQACYYHREVHKHKGAQSRP